MRNREIKFRAWHSQLGQMLNHDWMVSAGVLYSAISNPPEGQIVMQFTGLKDKNGIEVYDGDVIRYTLMAGLGMPERKGLTRIVKTDHMGSIGWYDTDIIVLGNRYQNPELLTQFELI